ncbi:MAG: amidohydrolase family protein [Proteobacteria bacterium]|nr:amidohydrolase family protein [Pseudomonadota bacterium]
MKWMLVACAGLIAIAPASAKTVYVHAGRLIDPATATVSTDRLIRVEDDKVAAISPWKAPPKGAEVVDWSGYTVLPGLIDLHTHLADVGDSADPLLPYKTSPAATALLGAQHALVTLKAGFTTVRDVGTYRAFTDVALRDAIAAGQVPGPRMLVAGAYITKPGGGGEVNVKGLTMPEDMRFGEASNPAEARDKAEKLFAGGADFLKLIATGAVLAIGTEPGQIELDEPTIRAAVEVAKAHGSYATAHAHGAEGIKAAIRGGVRSIEHASLIDDEGIALAKAKGVWLVMDIYDGDWIAEEGKKAGWPAEYLRKNDETTEAQRQGFAKVVKAGVRIGFGTDAGVYPHGLNARQFAYMVRYGMTPMQAIQSATVSAAELIGWQSKVGRVAPGFFADMIAMKGDPLKDVRVLEQVAAVMKGGAVVR